MPAKGLRLYQTRRVAAADYRPETLPFRGIPMAVMDAPAAAAAPRALSAQVTPDGGAPGDFSTPPAKPQRCLVTGECLEKVTGRRRAADSREEPECKKRKVSHALPGASSSIVGRASELEQIRGFVVACLEERRGGAMLVHGMPGTGKTMCVNTVVSSEDVQLMVPDSQPALYFNAVNIPDCNALLVSIISKLDSTVKAKPKQADLIAKVKKVLDERGDPLIVVVDEADQLQEKSLAALLKLPSHKSLQGKLVILGIVNILTVSAAFEKGANAPKRCRFEPYTHQELAEIVVSRPQYQDKFNPAALKILTHRTAAQTGDCRRMLALADVALRDAAVEGEAVVSAKMMHQLTTVSSAVRQLKSLPIVARCLLAVALKAQGTQRSFTDVQLRVGWAQAEAAVRLTEAPLLMLNGALDMLECYGLLRRQKAPKAGGAVYSFQVDKGEVKEALAEALPPSFAAWVRSIECGC